MQLPYVKDLRDKNTNIKFSYEMSLCMLFITNYVIITCILHFVTISLVFEFFVEIKFVISYDSVEMMLSIFNFVVS